GEFSRLGTKSDQIIDDWFGHLQIQSALVRFQMHTHDPFAIPREHALQTVLPIGSYIKQSFNKLANSVERSDRQCPSLVAHRNSYPNVVSVHVVPLLREIIEGDAECRTVRPHIVKKMNREIACEAPI